MNVETSSNRSPVPQAARVAIADTSCSTNSERLQIQIEQPQPIMPAVSTTPQPLLGKFLRPLLSQPNGGGLSQIPQPTLHDSLQLVISALEQLDAEVLLDLELVPEQSPSAASQQPPGPRVRDG